MALELRRNKDKSLKSKWWYGRFETNGKSHCMNLGIEVAGGIPATLREPGDITFERSRIRAQIKLEELKKEAVSQKAAERHLQELYEIKSGSEVQNPKLSELEAIWDAIPTRRTRTKQWTKTQHGSLKKFRTFIKENHPQVEHLSQVSPSIALEWCRSLETQGFSNETYNHKLKLLKRVFAPNSETGILQNPFDFIPQKKKNTVHRKPFTEAELQAVIEKCDEMIRPLFITGMCTAMRRGDCCLLKWESVDLLNGFIMVPTSKTGEVAEIPLFQRLRAELETRDQSGMYVFPEAARIYQHNSSIITHRMKKALADAQIESNIKANSKMIRSVKDFHSLRTTWITMALTAGVPMELVRRVTGHSTVDVVLKHYFRPGREAFRSALESALPRTLTGEVKNQKSPAEQLEELADKVDDIDRKKLEEEILRIAGLLAV